MKEILFKAVGTKAYPLDKRKSDMVAYVRLAWCGLHVVTCCAIIANFIMTHIT